MALASQIITQLYEWSFIYLCIIPATDSICIYAVVMYFRFKEVLVGYRHAMGNKPGGAVLVKLEEVKMRGRKRTMEG